MIIEAEIRPETSKCSRQQQNRQKTPQQSNNVFSKSSQAFFHNLQPPTNIKGLSLDQYLGTQNLCPIKLNKKESLTKVPMTHDQNANQHHLQINEIDEDQYSESNKSIQSKKYPTSKKNLISQQKTKISIDQNQFNPDLLYKNNKDSLSDQMPPLIPSRLLSHDQEQMMKNLNLYNKMADQYIRVKETVKKDFIVRSRQAKRETKTPISSEIIKMGYRMVPLSEKILAKQTITENELFKKEEEEKIEKIGRRMNLHPIQLQKPVLKKMI